jgi:glycosyltransferase involved in cell wall biosynthesis
MKRAGCDWHLITSEYPPQIGGVSDHTRLIAVGLTAAGEVVHVWCPPSAEDGLGIPGVIVHRELGSMKPADLRRVGRMLDHFPAPRRLLVQWVPHGYGYRSMNIQFCLWLWGRAARSRDEVELIVHEPFLEFGKGWKRNAASLMHRVMAAILLRAASRVWVPLSFWEDRLRPYSFGRRVSFSYLPIPSSVPVVCDAVAVARTRARYASQGSFLIGHFSTCYAEVAKLLKAVLPTLLLRGSNLVALLIGKESCALREELIGEHAGLVDRIYATGPISAEDISQHLSACDLMLQPYPDGANGRHSSLMACLSHGLPVVSNVGHLTEGFWLRSGALALAPDGDSTAIVELAWRLLSDASERLRMGMLGAAFYREHFDVSCMIDALHCRRAGAA